MNTTSGQYFDCLCRTCMNLLVNESFYDASNKPHQWSSILDTVEEFSNLSVGELLSITVPRLNVQEGDELPKEICRQCLQNLLGAYRFQQMCLQSQQHMRTLIAKRNTDLTMMATETSLKGEPNSNLILKQEPPAEARDQGFQFESVNTSQELSQSICDNLTKTTEQGDISVSEFLKEEPRIMFELPEATQSDMADSLKDFDKTTELDINLLDDINEFVKNEPCDDNESNMQYSRCEFNTNKRNDEDENCHGNTDAETLCSSTAFAGTNNLMVEAKEQKKVISASHNCHICNKTFTQSRYLARHLKRHKKWGEQHEMSVIPKHNEKTIKKALKSVCELCEQTFSTPASLEKHNRIMHETTQPKESVQKTINLPCDLCDITYSTLASLERHQRLEHSTELAKEPMKQHSCEFCDKTFEGPFMLKSHIQSVHTKARPYRCPKCDKSYTTPSGLKEHRYRSRNDKVYKCPCCPLKFCFSSDVVKHKKNVHKEMKPHVCDICGASFSLKYLLKIHQAIHTGVKPYKCDHCEKCFYRRGQQRIHMRNHTGEKPYKCKYCRRDYARLSDLVYHLRTHLGENVYRCELCPLAFPFASEKRLHLDTHKNDDAETRARNMKALQEEEAKIQAKVAAEYV